MAEAQAQEQHMLLRRQLKGKMITRVLMAQTQSQEQRIAVVETNAD